MTELSYTPDREYKVHSEGVIRLLCSDFQSHETGLPEWVKNASDAYARQNAQEDERAIVLIFDHNRKQDVPSISCLDFCGMTVEDIEKDFRHWGSPDAAQGDDPDAAVQGGHGNGGKCYMIQMFGEYAMIHTVREDRASRYGVPAGRPRFGYIPGPEEARNYRIDHVTDELSSALGRVHTKTSSLPGPAARLATRARGFTLVTGFGPVGYDRKIPVQHLLHSLRDHPQMIRSLELCSIYVVVNGRPYEAGTPLELKSIDGLEGAKEPREIRVPRSLVDPASKKSVPTVEDDQSQGILKLSTSKVSMRWKKKYRHNILYRAGAAGVIGYIPVIELDVQSPYRDHIYGEVTLPSLSNLKQNARRGLADSPLSRALNDWLSSEVQKYAKEFEARDRRKYAHEERDAVSKMNEALDKWKNRFLNELVAGFWGEGEGGKGRRGTRLPAGRAARMEFTLSHKMAGVGVALRPTLRFYDREGRQIRAVPYRWVSDDTNVAWVDDEVGVINTFSRGITKIWAETLDETLKSNAQELQVVGIHDIKLDPNELELAVGSRSRIEAECVLADGYVTRGVYLVWTEGDGSVARVSSSGLVFGFGVGETEVTAGDDKVIASPATVTVKEGTAGGEGTKGGRGYPLILISGSFDRDPETGEEIKFPSDAPPVAQRPQDFSRNIWWINSAAPLAELYLDTKVGYGYTSREWRMYHLERVIEVVLQIAMIYGSDDREQRLSLDEWIVEWGNKAAEIQAAAVSDLSTFIATGELPTE